ncbi:MAG: hypothetical protein DMF00_15255, partial [Verrucomicrobia bacterium]
KWQNCRFTLNQWLHMISLFLFPLSLVVGTAGFGRGEQLSGQKFLRLIQIRLAILSLHKIWPVCQDKWPQASSLISNSRNAVNFSSAPTVYYLYGGGRTRETKLDLRAGSVAHACCM